MKRIGKDRQRLKHMYQRLFEHFGPQNWWPAESPFEVAVGAVLTQNTSWTNVEKAIVNLKEAGVMEIGAMRALDAEELSGLIRPAGYYNLKEKRLRNLLDFLAAGFEGNPENLSRPGLDAIRPMLLEVKGIGPETADSILLYAAGMPTFVIDAYTKRVLIRHGLAGEKSGYEQMRSLFMDRLEHDPQHFNEYHALLVQVAKYFCLKSKFECKGCPLDGC